MQKLLEKGIDRAAFVLQGMGITLGKIVAAIFILGMLAVWQLFNSGLLFGFAAALLLILDKIYLSERFKIENQDEGIALLKVAANGFIVILIMLKTALLYGYNVLALTIILFFFMIFVIVKNILQGRTEEHFFLGLFGFYTLYAIGFDVYACWYLLVYMCLKMIVLKGKRFW